MLSVRYDVFDPNTKKSGNEVATIDDLKFQNWTFAYQYFFNENIFSIEGLKIKNNLQMQ